MSNYIDTRDLYRRQCELQEELDTLETELQDMQESLDDAQDDYRECEEPDETDNALERIDDYTARIEDARKALSDWQEEYQEELTELDDLETEIGREWTHGEILIPEGEFTAYAQNLAEETGAIPADAGWPIAGNIDWDQAADELKQDFSCCTYQGTDYLFHS